MVARAEGQRVKDWKQWDLWELFCFVLTVLLLLGGLALIVGLFAAAWTHGITASCSVKTVVQGATTTITRICTGQ